MWLTRATWSSGWTRRRCRTIVAPGTPKVREPTLPSLATRAQQKAGSPTPHTCTQDSSGKSSPSQDRGSLIRASRDRGFRRLGTHGTRPLTGSSTSAPGLGNPASLLAGHSIPGSRLQTPTLTRPTRTCETNQSRVHVTVWHHWRCVT